MTVEEIIDDEAQGESVGLSTPDTCQLVGITYRQLNYWINTGRVEATDSHGSGYPVFVPWGELPVLETVVRLLECGIALDRAFKYAREMKDHGRRYADLPGHVRLVMQNPAEAS